MADETKKKILKTVGKALSTVVPGAKVLQSLKDLRNKKKKADFQKGDYSDIDSDETITLKVKSVDMPKYKNPDDKSVKMPTRKETGKFKSVDMPTRKEKKTITVPKYPKEFKSGGRAKLRGGGISQRGLGRAFMKGGKA